MAFSFNWAGLQVPKVEYTKAIDDPDFGKNLGLAARGYENRAAAKEYGKLLEDYARDKRAASYTKEQRIKAIKDELAQLYAAKQTIQAQLDTQPPQSEVPVEEAWAPTEEETQALVFEPRSATRQQIMDMQNRIGTVADGVWGPKSQAAYDQKYGYLVNPGVGNGITF